MKIFFASIALALVLGSAMVDASHCGAPMGNTNIASPGDGDTVLVLGSYSSDVGANGYTFAAKAGCTYTMSFCNNGGTSSAADPFATNGPFAQIWLAGSAVSATCTESGNSCATGTEHVWTAASDGPAQVVVDTYNDGTLSSYTLALTGDGDTCMCNSAGCGGDPHFKTWAGTWFDFHGVCDLVLLKAKEFSNGLGLDVNIRTKGRYQYSFIRSAAVKIGQDVLEVSSYGGYIFNGISNADLPAMMAGLFQVVHERKNNKEDVFTIQTGVKEQIVISTFKDLVSVRIDHATNANFGNSTGIMGRFADGAKIGRDGVTLFEDENAFGREWQILESEPALFQVANEPQHPQGCIMPAATSETRRLGETLADSAAEKACDHWGEGDTKDMCIFDVKAMNDLEVAQATGAY